MHYCACAYYKYIDTGESRSIFTCAHYKKHFGLIIVKNCNPCDADLGFGIHLQNKTRTPYKIWEKSGILNSSQITS